MSKNTNLRKITNYLTADNNTLSSNVSQTITGSLTVTGNLTAQQFIVSSSVTYLTESFASGSHKFGDSSDDNHNFTGSLIVSGSANPLRVGSNLLFVSSSGFIGINNVSPTVALDVTGAGRISSSLGVGAAAAYASTTLLVRSNSSTSTNWAFIAEDNATNQIFGIRNNGNVGIGTGSPNTLLTTNQTGTTGYFYSGQQSGTEIAYWYYNANEVQFSSKAAARALTFLTTDTERMRITATGNVGIGTSSPLGNLDVRGANRLISADGIFQVNSSDSVGINLGGSLSFGGAYQSSDVTEWAQISGRKENATSGQYGGYLDFATRPHLGLNTSRMRITSGGSLLIGTTVDNNKGNGAILHSLANENASLYHKGAYQIANGGTKTLSVDNGSLIFVSENNTGDGALFHACYVSATVTLISNPSGRYANTDTASKICLFKSAASGTATLKNNTGSQFSFTTYIIINSD